MSLIPTVIDPRDLLKWGEELDEERESVCLCQKTVKLGQTKLVWLDCGDGVGWRCCCNQPCFLLNVTAGFA